MTERHGPPPARTVLELKIRERRETLEEFIEYVERFRRDHNETGTLSVRHLERLIAGRRGDGRPLGPVRPATARLLERIFALSVVELLAPPASEFDPDIAAELRERLRLSKRVDHAMIGLLSEQLNGLRSLDRQLGASVVYDEVRTKIAQLATLQSHCLLPNIRAKLSGLLAELSALAGWEALDLGAVSVAWIHHERAKQAAREAESPALLAHAIAQQSVILIDLGETKAAIEQLDGACRLALRSTPLLMQSWLAAAQGEGLAAAGHRDLALRAFDTASARLPTDAANPDLPFLFLGGAHLDRWRGHGLAMLGDPEAFTILADALRRLDQSFSRARAALQVDLLIVFMAHGEHAEARKVAECASQLATEIGSLRQQRRIHKVSAFAVAGKPEHKA